MTAFLWNGSAAASQQASAGQKPASTSTAASAAASKNYVVGIGDQLEISVWKQPQLSVTATVRPDGKITVPLINDVEVNGMTTGEIQALLQTKLAAFVKDPEVTVTVMSIGSKMVYLIGAVGKPGAFPMVKPMNVLQLIASAGGLSPFAHQKKIYVLRKVNGKEVRYNVNYKDLVKGIHEETNITLEPGDTVVVP